MMLPSIYPDNGWYRSWRPAFLPIVSSTCLLTESLVLASQAEAEMNYNVNRQKILACTVHCVQFW